MEKITDFLNTYEITWSVVGIIEFDKRDKKRINYLAKSLKITRLEFDMSNTTIYFYSDNRLHNSLPLSNKYKINGFAKLIADVRIKLGN